MAIDAIASVEMGEHVGAEQYPLFAAALHDHVRPGGRVLVQQMSRSGRHPGGGPFIESFIAPDMHMRPVGETVGLLERAGLEVRDVQAHAGALRAYRPGLAANFESRGPVSPSGDPGTVRVWRLYLVGGALAFEEGRMGVDQILAARPRR